MMPRRRIGEEENSVASMERKVFEAFFTLTVNFITAGPLTMERFTAQKQALINTECVPSLGTIIPRNIKPHALVRSCRYGDMRLPVMEYFKKVWNVLGPRQTLFIKVPRSCLILFTSAAEDSCYVGPGWTLPRVGYGRRAAAQGFRSHSLFLDADPRVQVEFLPLACAKERKLTALA